MCLMLYLASEGLVPGHTRGPLTVAAVDDSVEAKLRSAFTKPNLRFLGVEDGCSCGFPSVQSDGPSNSFEGMLALGTSADRAHSVACVRSLVELIAEILQSESCAELLPVWAQEEGVPPIGRIELRLQDVVAEEFFFVEQFVYEVRV